jgi:hypothetical protein
MRDVRWLVRSDIVTSKKQAAAIGDAIAHGNRTRPRQLPYQFRLYPELEKIPSEDREVALKDAKRRALRSWPMALVGCVNVGLVVLLILSWESESSGIEQVSVIVAFMTTLSGWVFRSRVRAELRRSAWRPRSPSLEELLSASSDEG